MGIRGKALSWLRSFLTGRTQQVRLGDSLSSSVDVTSVIVQGSTLGPDLFTIFADSLLRSVSLPFDGFADDIQFLADVIVKSKSEVQAELDKISIWSDENNMPLSFEKTIAMHCGHCQPFHEYHIKDQVIKAVNNFTDLGVRRSANAPYSSHCEALATKASKVAGAIRRAFLSNSRSLLWPAFEL